MIHHQSCALALIKMYFLLTDVGRGGALASSLFCPPPFLSRESQTEKPVGSLFECQNSRRGKGSRARWLKFLPPCWLHLPNKLCFLFRAWMQHDGWGSARWQTIREAGFKLQMEKRSKYYMQKTECTRQSYCYQLISLFFPSESCNIPQVKVQSGKSAFLLHIYIYNIGYLYLSPLGADKLFLLKISLQTKTQPHSAQSLEFTHLFTCTPTSLISQRSVKPRRACQALRN